MLAEWRRGRKDKHAFTVYIRAKVTTDEDYKERDRLLREIDNFEEYISASSEEDLAFFWRTRNGLDREAKFKMRTMIWTECERRYNGLTRKPITLRIPYFEELDGGAVRRKIFDRIGQMEWPQFLIDWHCSKVKIVTEAQPCLEDILSNVNNCV